MSEVKLNSSDETMSQTRLETLRTKIRSQRSKAIELLKKGSAVRNDIYELLLILSDQHRIENIDDVCDFMEEIEEKYGLTSIEDSDMSGLYSELQNESMKDTLKKLTDMSAKQGDGSFKVEFTDSDDAIFSNPDADSEDVIKMAEERISLYKELLHNMENSTYEHQLLLERLNEIQKRHDEIEKRGESQKAMHPRIEDFR